MSVTIIDRETETEKVETGATPRAPLTPLGGWGRYPVVEGRELVSEDLASITREAVLTRGLGRSYGDASLPPEGGHTVAASRMADRILDFDPETGVLRAEAGLSLARINRVLLERGWFVPVTPGTQFVTLGGMVAADVHGKNHHVAGTFGRHVERLKMRVADGSILEVSDEREEELFRATLGGMGLTGHVLEVSFRMERVPSPWIWSESEPTADLEAHLERLVEAGRSWPMTVGWVDLTGRPGRAEPGILFKGRWATPDEIGGRAFSWPGSVDVPLLFPNWVLNHPLMRAYSRYYALRHGRRTRVGIVHPQEFFYPLDSIQNWNRIYGARGFTQYQCVLPYASGADTWRRLVRIIAEHDAMTYLCVVKDFGEQGRGTISFPQRGITFTFDLPVRLPGTQRLVDALNDVVVAEGGRVYLAKDAFTRREHFLAMDDRIAEFDRVRRNWDPEGRLRSAQSVRLFGDRA